MHGKHEKASVRNDIASRAKEKIKMKLSSLDARPKWSKLSFILTQCTKAWAQDAMTAPTPSPSAVTMQPSLILRASARQTHTIQVGLLDHKVRPETIDAGVGDTVEFEFYPLNHSIVRAEYGFPCIPYEMTGSNKSGFFSGFRPVDKVLDEPPKYSIAVNDTNPILFYCSAPGSCITYGMVGGINLNKSMSIEKQRLLAMDSSYMLQPGGIGTG